MPRDVWLEQVRSVDASAASEIERLDKDKANLRAENATLRTLLVEFLRVVKEVEFNLRNALDKDKR